MDEETTLYSYGVYQLQTTVSPKEPFTMSGDVFGYHSGDVPGIWLVKARDGLLNPITHREVLLP